MSEFGGLWKHEKKNHALVGLGSAALVAAIAIPRKGDPKGIIKCIQFGGEGGGGSSNQSINQK